MYDGPDRHLLHQWVTRSLIKRNIWGSGLDSTLGRIRQAIDSKEGARFPVSAIEQEMAGLGKTLTFEDTEIDELLELKYAGQRTFAVLAILYPGLDLSKEFHEDHIFPRSRFTPKRLQEAGVPGDQVEQYRELVDRLPNLQLLGGTPNIEKQAKLPAVWLEGAFPTDEMRKVYQADNDLDGVGLDVLAFCEFFEARKEKMRARLTKALASPAV